MNFDDIQSAWNNEDAGHIKVPDTITRMKGAQMPVEKIRKNMRNEFYIQLIAIILIGFAPNALQLAPIFYVPFYAVYAIMILITAYYFFKFYHFYKRLSTNTLNSRDNLYGVYYDIKLHVELYKAFTYSLLPLGLLVIMMVVMSREGRVINMIQTGMMPKRTIALLCSGFGIMVLAVLVATEIWVNANYGKYEKLVKKTLDEFREE
ncbi:hypothetical protein [Chitinophaga nivalis]|uniref:Uncharacterized protein n=1 Tax=Chitinophaga nivalis TaxID=2991709 RepID=A0ABT3IER3_9BACT|nr:hypothetical protein [Chitinophaga nivalis]MCW3467865.1 hypothetical protein [Chitinophaga nivalis]MCW3482444.1 hypothetical protein [Chitinophaga nivalis]